MTTATAATQEKRRPSLVHLSLMPQGPVDGAPRSRLKSIEKARNTHKRMFPHGSGKLGRLTIP